MCGSPLPGSQLQLSTGSLDFAVTIIMIVGKNCPAVHCNLVKDLGNIWRWVQNTDFTECCGSCTVWRHLLRELYKQNLTCVSAFPSRLDSHFPADWTLHPQWAQEPGCCCCVAILEHRVGQCCYRAWPTAVPGCCSGWVPEMNLDKLALN